MRDEQAGKLSHELTESLISGSGISSYPTVFGIENQGAMVVKCPFCSEPHIHGLMNVTEVRGATCGQGAYWVVPVKLESEGKQK